MKPKSLSNWQSVWLSVKIFSRLSFVECLNPLSAALHLQTCAHKATNKNYYRYSALGPVWAETRAQLGEWYDSCTLHSGQVLVGSLPLPPPYCTKMKCQLIFFSILKQLHEIELHFLSLSNIITLQVTLISRIYYTSRISANFVKWWEFNHWK